MLRELHCMLDRHIIYQWLQQLKCPVWLNSLVEETSDNITHHSFSLTIKNVYLIPPCVLSHFSHVRLSATLWTVVCQAPLSMGLSRQEYWGGLQCLPPGDLPKPGIKPTSLTSPTLVGRYFTASAMFTII